MTGRLATARRRAWVVAGVLLATAVGFAAGLVVGVLGSGSTAASVDLRGVAGPAPGGSPGPTPAPTLTPSSAPSPGPATGPSPAPTRAPSPWPGEPPGDPFVTGSGRLTAGDVAGFDLDDNQFRWLIDSIDLSATVDGVAAQNGAQVARWDGPGAPDLRDCRGLPAADWAVPFIEAAEFDQQATFCVESTDGRFGHLTTQRVVRTSAGEPREFHFFFVLWAHPRDS